MALRFAAREYDAETGLYYNRARYYDPATGRFISEDPIGLAGGINQYAYAGNNPINATDPSGMICTLWWMTYSQGGVERSYWEHSGDCAGVINGGFPARPSGRGLGEDASWDRKSASGTGSTLARPVEAQFGKCALAAVNASLDVAGDIAFFTGFGLGAKLAYTGVRSASTIRKAGSVAYSAIERGMLETLEAKFLYGDNPGKTLKLSGRVARGALMQTGVSFTNGFASGELSGMSLLKNFLPFVNAYGKNGSLAKAYGACIAR